MCTSRTPPRVLFAAAYLVVTGVVLLFTGDLVWTPVVRWLRDRTDAEVHLLLRLGAKALIATGLAVIAAWAWHHHRARRAP